MNAYIFQRKRAERITLRLRFTDFRSPQVFLFSFNLHNKSHVCNRNKEDGEKDIRILCLILINNGKGKDPVAGTLRIRKKKSW